MGLGWIGLPLGRLLKANGHEVKGSTTSEEKASHVRTDGIEAFVFSLDPFPSGVGFQSLFQAQTLVLNIPPRTRSEGGEKYLEQLKFVKELVHNSPIQQVLYVSSTGVYPDQTIEEAYDESCPIDASNTGNLSLWKAEEYLKSNLECELTILRFGGLLGDERIPGRYFSGKENVIGHTRVNFIYRQDAARMMQFIIENELWNETFNGVAPHHPQRKEVYARNSEDLGIPLPISFAPEKEKDQRLISPQKILDKGFQFDFPDPLNFPYSAG